jgi:hypothetical protein
MWCAADVRRRILRTTPQALLGSCPTLPAPRPSSRPGLCAPENLSGLDRSLQKPRASASPCAPTNLEVPDNASACVCRPSHVSPNPSHSCQPCTPTSCMGTTTCGSRLAARAKLSHPANDNPTNTVAPATLVDPANLGATVTSAGCQAPVPAAQMRRNALPRLTMQLISRIAASERGTFEAIRTTGTCEARPAVCPVSGGSPSEPELEPSPH